MTVEVVNDVEDYINLEAAQIVEDTIHDIESEFDIVSEKNVYNININVFFSLFFCAIVFYGY